MIPQKIHYCWFGGNPLPESAIKCINSWKKFFPNYEIIEWNESNFDINLMPYTQEAYAAKKYAFVSDVARFWILEKEGGLYFDTDVEVIAPMDDIIQKGGWMGIEVRDMVNPGLGMGADAHNRILQEILAYYRTLHFVCKDGKVLVPNVVDNTTRILKDNGMTSESSIQEIKGIWIYPQDFFNPLDDATGIVNRTANTRSIHWYAKTWCNKTPLYFKLTRLLHRIFGTNFFHKTHS